MSSNRLIFLFLAIVLLVVVILSSKRIATTLRSLFGKYVPGVQNIEEVTPSPTLTPFPTLKASSPTPISNRIASPTPNLRKYPATTQKSSLSDTIPSTGPESVVWLLLGGGLTSGFTLRRWGSSKGKKS